MESEGNILQEKYMRKRLRFPFQKRHNGWKVLFPDQIALVQLHHLLGSYLAVKAGIDDDVFVHDME